jgi:hypothetical protein
MDGVTIATLCLAIVTLFLVVATLALVGVTVWLVIATKGAAKRQLQVQTWLEMAKRFDSKEMKKARKELAEKIQTYSANDHNKISETVIDFFEDVGTLLKRDFIDEELVVETIGFYGSRWWAAMQPYVSNERRKHKDDATIFADFEFLAKETRLPHEQIDDVELTQFLNDEARLVVD